MKKAFFPLRLRLKKIIFYLLALLVNLIYKPKQNRSTAEVKVIYLHISRSPYKRYLYLLIKFFHMEGYRVYLPDRLKLLADLHRNKYAKLLITEKIINLGNPPEELPVLHVEEELITGDYFAYRNAPGLISTAYFIPFTQHPLMYHHGYWNRPLEAHKRKKTLFMAGNFDKSYSRIEREGIFQGMHSRLSVKDHLGKSGRFHPIKNEEQLQAYVSGDQDHKVILIDTGDYEIPMAQFRPTLARFDYFLSLPGVHIPFCHNLVEAMSVGCIPFMQEAYARLMVPALVDGDTCITFTDLGDLDSRLEQAMGLEADKIAAMRSKVLEYYQAHCTPAGQVRRIEKMDFSRLYLQAEAYSVELEKKRVGGE